MFTLYLVRHGETTHNAEGRFQGHQDIALSELGLRQAETIACRLASVELEAIYSSDLIRASATAEVMAARHRLPVQTTPLLREAKLGVVEGLTPAEVDERYPPESRGWGRDDPLNPRPPGAETPQELNERAKQFLDETLPAHPEGSRLLVVAHGGSARAVLCAGLDLPLTLWWKLHFANASLSIIELGDNPGIRLLNDTSHLDAPITDASEVTEGEPSFFR